MLRTLLVKDPNKIKTWLLPRDLVKEVKQYVLDDTNVTAVIIDALTDFLSKKDKNNKK
jgi:hypothetical protein